MIVLPVSSFGGKSIKKYQKPMLIFCNILFAGKLGFALYAHLVATSRRSRLMPIVMPKYRSQGNRRYPRGFLPTPEPAMVGSVRRPHAYKHWGSRSTGFSPGIYAR